MLAFYKAPEKWVKDSYIKIRYFGDSDADLKYQDEIYGSLIEQVEKTINLVYTKYLKALIFIMVFRRPNSLCFIRMPFVKYC